MRGIVLMLALLVALCAGTSATADWKQPVNGPLNVDPTHNAEFPRTASVAGVPWVTWNEGVGADNQIYVKYLKGTSWAAAGGSLNIDPGKDAQAADIANIGGVPYVTWFEPDATADQVR